MSSHWQELDDSGYWESDMGENYSGIDEEGDDTFRTILSSYPWGLESRGGTRQRLIKPLLHTPMAQVADVDLFRAGGS